MDQESPRPRLTRRRTGCLKCRVRRRKCDEGKPHCRNCIEKNLECQYGPRLTFLERNTITVAQPKISSPLSTSEYGDIRFVNEHPERSIDDGTLDNPSSPFQLTSDTQPGNSLNETPLTRSTHQANAEREVAKEPRDVEPTDVDGWMEDREVDTPQYKTPQYPEVPSNDGDESAIRGLLALGTASPERAVLFDSLGLSHGRHELDDKTRDVDCDLNGTGTAISPPEFCLGKNDDILSETRVLHLLRHYRYGVAPWLDIFDLQQSFGISALQTITVSNSVLSAILSLSQLSLGFFQAKHGASNPQCTSFGGLVNIFHGVQVDANDTINALSNVIGNVQIFLTSIPRAWECPPEIDVAFLGNLALHSSETSLKSAAYWLFLRLELSASLASDTSIRVPLPVTFATSPSEIGRAENVFGRVFYYAITALFLCAKALQWCNNESGPSQVRTVENWVQIIDELSEWYHNRPQEFHPMLELSIQDPGENFPVVLFSHGAGVFGNQLYHTAMLLLIQAKPRTAKLVNYQPAIMSPLWHARQICSIALNNDRRECWDLSLLASFLVAARRMTHESQHNEILNGFDRIRALTGWDIHESLCPLREEWFSI